MKTSNKILVGMVVVLVLIPTFIMVALAMKVKNEDYTIEMTEWEKMARVSKVISNTGYMKLTAPQGSALNCTIHYSDSVYYRKHGSHIDSLSIENIGDTLCFTVIQGASGRRDDGETVYLDVFMPFKGLLMLDGAEARIDSVNAETVLQVNMVNNSRFSIGNDEQDRKRLMKFASLFVKADNSNLFINDQSEIDAVQLSLTGAAHLQLSEKAVIGAISGSIAGTASVAGPAKWLYQLKPTL